MIFVDSNVIIDLVQGDPRWSDWSREAVEEAGAKAALVADAVVLAECAPRFSSVEEELDWFDSIGIAILDIPVTACFRAGQAHRDYRRAGGERTGILADFLIGGHASVLDATLVTRDRQRFATYFPELTLITPETEHG